MGVEKRTFRIREVEAKESSRGERRTSHPLRVQKLANSCSHPAPVESLVFAYKFPTGLSKRNKAVARCLISAFTCSLLAVCRQSALYIYYMKSDIKHSLRTMSKPKGVVYREVSRRQPRGGMPARLHDETLHRSAKPALVPRKSSLLQRSLLRLQSFHTFSSKSCEVNYRYDVELSASIEQFFT